ncbi:MAG: hypothetical protein KIT74_11490 [Fimbriimonadales bacterium]|nr:hypothetical protein [Fimbriimonadales bacterium]
MKPNHSGRREQKSVVFVALLAFILTLVLLQLWLFVAAFENMLAGHYEVAFPAGIASVAILTVNIWMLIGINRLDSVE